MRNNVVQNNTKTVVYESISKHLEKFIASELSN